MVDEEPLASAAAPVVFLSRLFVVSHSSPSSAEPVLKVLYPADSMCTKTRKDGRVDPAAVARQAVEEHPTSHIEMAMAFASEVCPAFLSQSNDNLVILGRSIQNLVQVHSDNLEQNLEHVIEHCQILSSGSVQVPKVRFGKTELQMPIVTLGCMRFQQEWGPRITEMNQIGSDCQDNLVRILRRAFELGINHIETARGYGCSELQLGAALKQLMLTGFVKREDFILQTKVRAFADAKEFRETLETSFRNLQVDYLDLFAFHGLNFDENYDWVFGEDGCYKVVEEYIAAGKIRHVGFSTHAPPAVIRRFIETDKFHYCNLHYHFFGSYTASGCGEFRGNLQNVRLMKTKDMGVFVISPYDKGGRLYAPSNKLRALTLPEMEPLEFGSAWLWNHHKLDAGEAPIHTIVCGAARPGDLDMPAVSAFLQKTQPDLMLKRVKALSTRLEKAMEAALGREWLANCYDGIPKSDVSLHSVEHNQIIWIYNMIQAFGLLDFGKNRYNSLEGSLAKWDHSLSVQENIDKVGRVGWGYVPGLPFQPGTDFSDDFVNVPEANKARVLEAEEFVHKWCTKHTKADTGGDEVKLMQEAPSEVPMEWETAVDMRPWPDFPDRPRRV